MKRSIAILVAALLVTASAESRAQAQKHPAPVIGIIDVQRLLSDSAAAKSIRPQIQRLRSDFQKEVRGRESVLRKAEQDLVGQRAILAPEAFAQRRRQFEERARKAQQEVQTRKRAIDRALATALNKIRVAFLKIARDVATENKINIVLAKSAVLMSQNNLEITTETMKRLNKTLPKVQVKLETPSPKKK